jgi:hypothetical protein
MTYDEQAKEHKRAYYLANREVKLEKRRAYYQSNRELELERQRAYRARRKERLATVTPDAS